MTFWRVAFKAAWDGKGSVRSAIPDDVIKLGNIVPAKDNGDGTWMFELWNDDNPAYSDKSSSLLAANAKLGALGLSVVANYVGKAASLGKFVGADGSSEQG